MGGRGTPSYLREQVIDRDGLTCQYCGRELVVNAPWPWYPTLDHVIPKAQGGETVYENLVVSCQPCNQKKRDRTPLEAGMRLLCELYYDTGELAGEAG